MRTTRLKNLRLAESLCKPLADEDLIRPATGDEIVAVRGTGLKVLVVTLTCQVGFPQKKIHRWGIAALGSRDVAGEFIPYDQNEPIYALLIS